MTAKTITSRADCSDLASLHGISTGDLYYRPDTQKIYIERPYGNHGWIEYPGTDVHNCYYRAGSGPGQPNNYTCGDDTHPLYNDYNIDDDQYRHHCRAKNMGNHEYCTYDGPCLSVGWEDDHCKCYASTPADTYYYAVVDVSYMISS